MSTALKDDLLHTAIPPGRLWSPPAPPALAPGIVHSRFSVQGDARQSFLAWQERMSPVYDIQPPSKRADDTFDASLSRYTIDNLSLFDFRTAPNLAVRSLGRVSTESIRDLTFSVYLDGQPGQFLGGKPQRRTPRTCPVSSRWIWINRAQSGVFTPAYCFFLCRARWWKSRSLMPPRCMAAGFTPPPR
jgi:hypothetical protein